MRIALFGFAAGLCDGAAVIAMQYDPAAACALGIVGAVATVAVIDLACGGRIAERLGGSRRRARERDLLAIKASRTITTRTDR